MLGRGAHKFVQFFHDGGQSLCCPFLHSVLPGRTQSTFTQLLTGGASRFGNSIGIDEQHVVALEDGGVRGKFLGELNAEGDAFRLEALDRTIFAKQDRGIVAGRKKGEFAGGGIKFGQKGSREASTIQIVGADQAIEIADKLRERTGRAGERAKARLENGHQHRGGNTFPGDIGHSQEQRTVAGAAEGVVVVAGYGLCWTCGEGPIDPGKIWRDARNEPTLNFAGDFNTAPHGDVIARDHD